MKKQLLLGAALLAAAGAYAQTDITPANYKFATAKVIPWWTTFEPGVQLDTNGNATDIWGSNNFQSEWNDGLFVQSSAGQNENQQEGFRNGWALVDLGGEVGQVAMFAGKASGIVDYLNELQPDMSANWEKIAIDDQDTQGFRLHIFMDPATCPQASEGYIHVKMVYNIYSPNANQNRKVFQNIGLVTNGNGNQSVLAGDGKENVWSTSGNYAFLESDCVKRYEDDNEPELDPQGNMIWDPTKWVVVEFDFAVSDADDDGVYTPARLALQAMNGSVWNDYAFFLKELSFTQMEGLPESCNFSLSIANYEPFGASSNEPGDEPGDEPSNVPEMLYMIGDGPGWTPDAPLQATTAVDGVFTFTDVTLSNETSYFSFINTVNGDWDVINDGEHRYGPAEGTEAAITVGTTTEFSLGGDTSWNMPGGTYTFVMNFNNNTLTVSGDAGVSSIVDDNAPVEYYNLQGVKVANPEKGVYIKKQGNTTTKVVVK